MLLLLNDENLATSVCVLDFFLTYDLYQLISCTSLFNSALNPHGLSHS